MSTWFRWFVLAFAAGMTVVTAFSYSIQHRDDTISGVLLISPTAFYILFAAFAFVPESQVRLRRLLLCLLFPAALWQFTSTGLDPGSNWSFILVVLQSLCYFLVLCLLFFSRSKTGLCHYWASPVQKVLLFSGTVLVLASLFTATGPDGSGWAVVARKVPWITLHVNPVQDPTDGQISAVSHLYGTVGSSLYTASVVLAIATTVFLFKIAIRPGHTQQSKWTPRLAGLSLLVNMWIVTESFWGWKFALHDSPVSAIVATICWATAIAFGCFVAFRVAHSSAETWHLQAYMLFQIPLVLFSIAVSPAYFGDMFTDFPGIAFLQGGLLLLALTYLSCVMPGIEGAKTSNLCW